MKIGGDPDGTLLPTLLAVQEAQAEIEKIAARAGISRCGFLSQLAYNCVALLNEPGHEDCVDNLLYALDDLLGLVEEEDALLAVKPFGGMQ